MGLISKPFTFSAGAVIIASQHNSNFDTVYNLVNGALDGTNLASNAAIADTQLGQITTAGKVSGAALTSLSSIPSGAGVVPIANLATGTPTGSKFIRDDGTLQTAGGSAATQAEMETATSTTVFASPGRTQYHPGVAKALCIFNGATTGTNAPTAGYNVTSVTRNSAGNYTVTFTTAFSSTNYVPLITGKYGSASQLVCGYVTTFNVGSMVVIVHDRTDALNDADYVSIVVYGDQ